jgi:hypothetical protein
MLAAQPQENKPPLKRAILYSWLALAAVLVYVLWIFFARWKENRDIQRHMTEVRIEKQREQDRRTVEMLGGKELSILEFYGVPRTVHPGERLQLCYSVANAKSVKLSPQDSPVWPSYSRCVDVAPKKDTTYTLTIEDGAGHVKSQTLDVKVR